ncbi:MAG TPA: glycosyltransferase family 92 protein [Sphingomicrobium sp.]|nr:glycosyltransferase family 92 protein [Sphingomicrobium sp.]
MFQNEARYLDEWLAFCVLEGVEQVILYDHFSTDNARELLQPWIDAGIVQLIDWPVPWDEGAQGKACLDALRRLRGRSRWAAFIDIDEFLFSPTGRPLPEILRGYEDHAGVIVNWQCYGTSGHKMRPSGLVIESYTRRARRSWARNRRVKTVVDPLLAVEPQSPHLFSVQPGEALVTENLTPVRVIRAKNGRRRLRRLAAVLPYLPFDPYSVMRPSIERVSVRNLRINHYATRSQEELPLKYKDRKRMLEGDRRTHWRYHDRNEVEDRILVEKAEAVRQIIDAVRAGAHPFQRRKRALA